METNLQYFDIILAKQKYLRNAQILVTGGNFVIFYIERPSNTIQRYIAKVRPPDFRDRPILQAGYMFTTLHIAGHKDYNDFLEVREAYQGSHCCLYVLLWVNSFPRV